MSMDKLRNLGAPARVWTLLCVVALAAGFCGCSRRHYRERADREVFGLLREKDVCPEWKIESFDVYPDPRARHADPTRPDRPPMPPDDPAASALSPHPQKPGHAGVARVEGYGWLQLLADWNAQNRVEAAHEQAREAEQPKADPGKTEPPTPQPFLIKLEQAAELGMINSREYQTRRENLYLAALPVTLERFAFTPQFFAFEEAVRERSARESRSGYQNRWAFASDFGFTKLFSTGALLLVRFANNTVVNLTGRTPHTVSVSDVSLDVVQPFLRGGGRAVTLEPLTQAERNLVYEIRDYARFRKQYYVGIAGGTDFSISAAFTGRLGGGLTPGLSAVSGVPLTRPQIPPGSSGRLALGTTDTAPAEGYLPTLERAANLENAKKNVVVLESFYERFKDLEGGGTVAPLQVEQVKLDLLQAQSTVLQTARLLDDARDRFKLQLGIPVNTLIELDRTPIRPILDQFEKIERVLAESDLSMQELKDNLSSRKLASQFRQLLRKFFVETRIVKGTPFSRDFNARWDEWSPAKLTDPELYRRVRKAREYQERLHEAEKEARKEGRKLTPEEQRQLAEADAQVELAELEIAVRNYERAPWDNLPGPGAFWPATVDPQAREFLRQGLERLRQALHNDLFQRVEYPVSLVLVIARNQRLAPLRGAGWPRPPRLELGDLDLLELDADQAYAAVTQAALANRVDLMNARANVVDAWRQLRIFANSLLGTFDVAYHFDSTTPGGQARPLAFTGARNRHQLFFNLELPLVRLAERNAYRASLIAYQRARRNLMAAEDAVAAQVRAEMRQLRLLAENYAIQREAVELAYLQVESSLATLNAPPDPAGGRDAAASAAALTQQLLNAQRSLPRLQDQLISVWVNYLVVRLQLYLDMELLPVDSRGVWIDELATRRSLPPPDGPAGPGDPGAAQQRVAPEVLPPLRPVAAAAAGALE